MNPRNIFSLPARIVMSLGFARFSDAQIFRPREKQDARALDLEAQVQAAVDGPLETIQTRHGRTAVCARSSGKYLVVVLEKSGGELIVVTALKVDKERARRYGFDRV